MNILFMKPGQMPSMPHIGINIRQYLYAFEDELKPDEIREKIVSQCREVAPYIDMSGTKFFIVDIQNNPIWMLMIPMTIDSEQTTLLIGMKKDTNSVAFNYQFDESSIF